LIILAVKGVYHDVAPDWSTRKARGLSTLVYVTDGTVIYSIDNKRYELEKGEICYIPHHMDRSWTSHPQRTHNKYAVVFSWEAAEIPPFFRERDKLFRFKPRNSAYFEQRLAFLFMQCLGQRTYYEPLTNSILTELLILISQEKTERSASSAKEQIVRKVQEHILYNFRRNITIDELTEIAGVTPSYITALFKEVVGVTPIQYLHQIRIGTACNLLNNTQMTVGEVAEYLGYCDQSYFNRMFKKWMGTAPTRMKS
jgi:AraC-like DNA-binding protein